MASYLSFGTGNSSKNYLVYNLHIKPKPITMLSLNLYSNNISVAYHSFHMKTLHINMAAKGPYNGDFLMPGGPPKSIQN